MSQFEDWYHNTYAAGKPLDHGAPRRETTREVLQRVWRDNEAEIARLSLTETTEPDAKGYIYGLQAANQRLRAAMASAHNGVEVAGQPQPAQVSTPAAHQQALQDKQHPPIIDITPPWDTEA